MRTTKLATIALKAEKLRLQRKVKVIVGRIVIGAVGALMIALCLIFLHLAAYDALQMWLAPHWSALIVAAVDIVVAVFFLLIACRNPFDPAQADARRVRDDALHQLRNSMMLTAAVGPVSRLLGKKAALGVGAATFATQWLNRRNS